MYRALDENGREVEIVDSIKGKQYYCPICKQPIIRCTGDIYQHYFRHQKDSECTDKWNYDMSPWHRAMQLLFDSDYREKTVSFGGILHRADILKDNVVVEFQHSQISLAEFNGRNEFYLSCGYRVAWVFDVTDSYRSRQFRHSWNKDSNEYYWDYPKKMLKQIHPAAFEEEQRLSICLCWTIENTYSMWKIAKSRNGYRYICMDSRPLEITPDIDMNDFFVNGGIEIIDETTNNLVQEKKKEQADTQNVMSKPRFAYQPDIIPKEEFLRGIVEKGNFKAIFENVGGLGFKYDELVCPKGSGSKKQWLDINQCTECRYCGGIEKMNSLRGMSKCCYCFYPKVVNEDEIYNDEQYYGRRIKPRK